MNTLKLMTLVLMSSASLYGADNEIYIDQSGDSANIDLEQLGSSNIIGGLESTAGSLNNPLDLDGDNLNLTLNQIGDSNTFLGDILGDNLTGYFNFDGNSNAFTIQVDPTNTYGADGSNLNVQATGDSNTFELNLATSALASNTDLDWIINGSSNTLTFDIDVDGAISYVDIDGDSNTVDYDGDGYADGYFYLDQTGDSRTFNIQQKSTLASDWLKIISNGDSGTVCVIQDDNGTAVGC